VEVKIFATYLLRFWEFIVVLLTTARVSTEECRRSIVEEEEEEEEYRRSLDVLMEESRVVHWYVVELL